MTTAIMTLSLLSCDDIYDTLDDSTPQSNDEQKYDYVNVVMFNEWLYFNLHDKRPQDTVRLNIYDTENVPETWDIALHHYDIKTNGAKALETSYSDIFLFKEDAENGTFPQPSSSVMVPDNPDDSVIIDLSTMFDGYVTYAKTPVNREISKWMNMSKLDPDHMPPTYTPSNKVYLLRFSDETFAAIHFTGFSNPNIYNTKGYISFEYLYPVNFR